MRTFAIFAAASVLFASSPAFADEVTFAYSPSELASKASVESLYKRIENRADSACGVNLRASLQRVASAKECAAALVDEFVENIGDSALIAEHEKNHNLALSD